MLALRFKESERASIDLRVSIADLQRLNDNGLDDDQNFIKNLLKEKSYIDSAGRYPHLNKKIQFDYKETCTNYKRTGVCYEKAKGTCQRWHFKIGCKKNKNCNWHYKEELEFKFNFQEHDNLLKYSFQTKPSYMRCILMAPNDNNDKHYNNDEAIQTPEIWTAVLNFANYLVKLITEQSGITLTREKTFDKIIINMGSWSSAGCGEAGHAHIQFGLSVEAIEAIDKIDIKKYPTFGPLLGRGDPLDDEAYSDWSKAVELLNLKFFGEFLEIKPRIDKIEKDFEEMKKVIDEMKKEISSIKNELKEKGDN